MEEFIATRWNKIAIPKLFKKDDGVFLFKFNSAEEMEVALAQGPCTYAGKFPLFLRPWKPGIKIDRTSSNTLKVWVTLPGLDLQFWSAEMLSKIISQIGKPCHTDMITAELSEGAGTGQISYARVLVEINVDTKLKEKITLRGPQGQETTQHIWYEWRPWQCLSCKTFGHKEGDCAKNKQSRTMKKWIPKSRKKD